ncbi:phosphatase PAP2 family protein [Novosphingobium sp. ZN18A2]|uniref:phosphatase PAP2 family protein n=1 Tax=Novosphingobium sp. ZN18A2 TaxID=3079861 RepID=UPI0030D297B0
MAGAMCWAGFLLIAWLVHIGAAQGFDRTGLFYWRTGANRMPWGPSWLPDVMLSLTALGGVLLRNLLALAAAAGLMIGRRTREAAWFAGTFGSAWIVDWLLKIAIARPRPEIVPHLTHATGMSFPSGHSFNSAAIYLAMALTFGALSQRRRIRVLLVAGAFTLSSAIALSRVWLGVHHPTDVIAGWLGGTGWALFAYALSHRSRAAGETG